MPELKEQTGKKTGPGAFLPLGATVEKDGVNFALYSGTASAVYLLLFNQPDGEPTDIIRIKEKTRNIRHIKVFGIKPGQLYGYKVQGPYDPKNGLRHNENKLLIDPYARALTHKFENKDNLLLGYDPLSQSKDLSFDSRDNTRLVPKSVVTDPGFDWQDDRPPLLPMEELVIYETHVKGFTASPTSGVKHPGTYPGFIEKIPHLKSLGINAVELLPVQEFLIDDFLKDRKLTNYWGYNTIAFFAPEQSYAAGRSPDSSVKEFKTMVRELHKAGIEVILDVVYNHTAEGSELGPTICGRGIDNPAYYVLTGGKDDPRRYYMNYTGCGNSVNLESAPMIRFVMDSLRYWAQEMHVDGFRFDLASVLGREQGGFRNSASFFDAIAQDPVLSRVKLIAEPWDLGTYQVGNFPIEWAEWNGRYRDTLRKFIKGDGGQVSDFATRFGGSADLYGDDGRLTSSSVNFITCHDGFTLYDLLSYNGKHNEANGENNNDGTSDNMSWNCGWEGPSTDPAVTALRARQARNFAAALLFSLGTPMILGGDEFLRTQNGNNNAYCQDNAVSHFDWSLTGKNKDNLEFFKKAIAFRKAHPALRRKYFLNGRDNNCNQVADCSWFGLDGNPPRWDDPETRSLAVFLDESEAGDSSDFLYLIFHSGQTFAETALPALKSGYSWKRVLDTSLEPDADFCNPGEEIPLPPGGRYPVNPRSVVVLLGTKI